MSRTRPRRPGLNVESLEGRALQSGLVATSADVPRASLILPYIEQENVRPPVTGSRPDGGEANQIIAILIG
jgi:hypothetical protein